MIKSIKTDRKRPVVILKFASSLDGYLNDLSNVRHIFSNEEDLREVDQLRASSDAILVGAETLRSDNPSLKLKFSKAKDPVRVTITASGELNSKSNFFKDDGVKKIVYSKSKLKAEFYQLKDLTVVEDKELDLKFLLKDLAERGIEKLLLEGGAKLIAEFLRQDLVNIIRIAKSSEILADTGKANLAEQIDSEINEKFELKKVKKLGNLSVIELLRKS